LAQIRLSLWLALRHFTRLRIDAVRVAGTLSSQTNRYKLRCYPDLLGVGYCQN